MNTERTNALVGFSIRMLPLAAVGNRALWIGPDPSGMLVVPKDKGAYIEVTALTNAEPLDDDQG